MINGNIDILDTVDAIDAWTRDILGILTIMQLAAEDCRPVNPDREAEESMNWVICNAMRGVIDGMKELSAAMNEALRVRRQERER